MTPVHHIRLSLPMIIDLGMQAAARRFRKCWLEATGVLCRDNEGWYDRQEQPLAGPDGVTTFQGHLWETEALSQNWCEVRRRISRCTRGARLSCCKHDASQLRCTTYASAPFKSKLQTKLGSVPNPQNIGNQARATSQVHPSAEGLAISIALHMSPELQQYAVPSRQTNTYCINSTLNARCPWPACSAMCHFNILQWLPVATLLHTWILWHQGDYQDCKTRHAHVKQLPGGAKRALVGCSVSWGVEGPWLYCAVTWWQWRLSVHPFALQWLDGSLIASFWR
jgi:hypothetical protein